MFFFKNKPSISVKELKHLIVLPYLDYIRQISCRLYQIYFIYGTLKSNLMKLPKWSKRLTFSRYLIRKSENTCKFSVLLLLRSGPQHLPTRGRENHIPATAGQPGTLACKLAFFFFTSKRVFYHLKWSKFKAEKAGHREGGRGEERRKKGSMHSSQSGRMRIYCGYTWNISDLSYNFYFYGPCCPRENTT